jgi:carbon storage regulator
MLVLSRKLSEQILIGSDISIKVLKIDRKHVRVGICAPRGVAIVREELRSDWRRCSAAFVTGVVFADTGKRAPREIADRE